MKQVVKMTIIICVLFIMGVAWVFWLQKSPNLPFSSQNPDENGVKALYLFYQKRGEKVQTWEEKYSDLPKGTGSTLYIAHPTKSLPDESEIQKLNAWMKRGNQVVLISLGHSEWTKAFQFTTQVCSDEEKVKAIATDRSQKWLADMYTLEWPHQECVANLGDSDRIIALNAQDEPLIVKRDVGDGRILYVPEPYFIQNEALDHVDHIAFFLWVVTDWNRTIYFDETIHSFFGELAERDENYASDGNGEDLTSENNAIQTPSWLSFILFLDAQVWFVIIQACILIILWFYAKGKRFSRPRYEKVKLSRDAMEYVEGLAHRYQKSNLRNDIVRTAFNQLNEQLNGLDSEGIREKYGSSDYDTYQKLSSKVNEISKFTKPISQSEMLAILQTIDRLRKEHA
ncbi:DUF4350 domain-containing protein [Hazenella sp. IB182357]|uniref:DUF4350 domain-containing protein n=1 Tax=Polycladospora coralii TaxID=2771432 RepID=A0A926N621_9BACL|nr:DUF4350 domain-containing protein [Polycladospora coralii]MBD1371516.1 DUF4350 domain-containing protein [Polycladospora coralii]MBS7528982.1 DUF4350 domain-containing protein [Polycladospora coralii]